MTADDVPLLPPGFPLGPIAIAVASAAAFALFAAYCQGAEAALHRLSEGGRLDALAASDGPGSFAFRRAKALEGRLVTRWALLRGAAIVIGSGFAVRVLPNEWPNGTRTVLSVGVILFVFRLGTEVANAYARRQPERLFANAVRLLLPLEWAIAPLAAPLAGLGHLMSSRIPERRSVEPEVAESALEHALSEGERSGVLENESVEMIRNVLELRELTVHNVMIPRTRIAAFALDEPLAEVLREVADDAHSRYPIYRDTIDQVVGLLYTKDLFTVVGASGDAGHAPPRDLSRVMRREVMVTVESQSALSVLREMRARRQHMAIVTDEFGGTAGLVTLEDILEEIVGEIDDEHDVVTPEIQRVGDGRYMADAAVSLAVLEKQFGDVFPSDGDFESLGGLIVHHVGRVPKVGAQVRFDGLRFTVREADETHVRKVEILRDNGRASSPTQP